MRKVVISLLLIVVFIAVVAGVVVWSGWLAPSLECQEGEVGLTKCVGRKAVVYQCVPDPGECRFRGRSDMACGKGRCRLQAVTDCKHPNAEQYLLRCVPEEALEQGPETTDIIRYQDEVYLRTEETLALPAIGEEDKIMELEQGEVVYLMQAGTPDEKIVSLKPENVGEGGQNTYILWQDGERFRYDKEIGLIKERIQEANSCTEDGDCSVVSFGCPFKCWSLVDKRTVEPLQNMVQLLEERYEFQCQQECAPFSGAVKCVDGLCQQ